MMIETVRSFNPTLTQRGGALDDHYLSRDRPLGESRVLWEVGQQECDVRSLRARLSLDSGYLSRLLRSLENAGLVRVAANSRDKRVRTVRLTAKGRKEWALLERRSDALAHSILEPLTDSQRDRLVAATTEVDRLLTAAPGTTSPVDPARHT